MRGRAIFLFPRPAWLAALLFAGLTGCAPQAAPPAAAPPAPPRPVAVAPPPPPVLVSPAPRHAEFRQVSIVLYQPDSVLKARLGHDAAPLAAYIRQVDRRVADVLDAAPVEPGFSAALVIALKPSGESRAWLVSKAKFSHKLQDGLVAAAQAVPPPSVQGGPVALAIIFNAFGGGGKPVVDAAHPIPIPPEWRARVAPPPLQGPAPTPTAQ